MCFFTDITFFSSISIFCRFLGGWELRGLFQFPHFLYYKMDGDDRLAAVSLDLATGTKTELKFPVPPDRLRAATVLGGKYLTFTVFGNTLILANLDSGDLLATVEGCSEIVNQVSVGDEDSDRLCHCWCDKRKKLFELSSG